MKSYLRYAPWAAVGLAAVYLVMTMTPAEDRSGKMDLGALGDIPVVQDGRPKPLDTVARNSLLVISGRRSFRDKDDHPQPAIKWLLDVMTSQDGDRAAVEYKVFRIENLELLSLLKLEPRPGFRYAISEFSSKLDKLQEQAERSQKKAPKDREVFDGKVIELFHHLQLYIQLARLDVPRLLPPTENDEDWQTYAKVNDEAQRAALAQLKAEAQKGKLDVSKLSKEQQQQLLDRFHDDAERMRAELNPAAQDWATIFAAYSNGQADRFNSAVADYRQHLAKILPEDVTKARFESFFNHFEPFYQCSILYVLVFILACCGWLGWQGPLNRAAFWLALLALVVHTWALGARMYLQGHPPVTNLYSSAVFIGWGCVVLSLVLEWIFRNGMGNVLAAVMGALTLIIAHNLASDGDTLTMMQAVLDTNFWLATHVTCVTLGYTATFVAGFLGILFVLRGVFTRSLDRSAFRSLSQMIYAVVCFATLLSFTGTVLGGIWADQSWGRFWGWDPKENGALIIVLWNALILHARWGGLVKQRGMALLAIGGNIVTSWSWFGVNMLGVGLHSYGFMEGAVKWLLLFVASQVALIAVGLIPMNKWLSFEPTPA